MSYKNGLNGFENENEFVYYFNKKRLFELDPISQDLLIKLYGEIKKDEIVFCKLNLAKQKSDIIISINNCRKYISIKKGYKNSVHTEHISSFVNYLRTNGMTEDLIQKLLRFHYGDGTNNGTGEVRFNSQEYYINYPQDIKELNVFFNNEDFIKKSVDRLILYGNNSSIPIDAIICGVPNDYMWITRDEIINICLKHKGIAKNGLAISGLFYQPLNRCINFNIKYDFARQYVQFKWYHISDDIIETMAFYR